MTSRRRGQTSQREAQEAVLRGLKRLLMDKGHAEADWALMATESDVDESFRKS